MIVYKSLGLTKNDQRRLYVVDKNCIAICKQENKAFVEVKTDEGIVTVVINLDNYDNYDYVMPEVAEEVVPLNGD